MAKKAAKKAAKKTTKQAKRPVYRLTDPDDNKLTAAQTKLRDAIFSGPRGIRRKLNGPFAIWMQAPEYGYFAQALGAHVRYNTALSPRQSEFAILCTGVKWKAQYEWFAHEPMALKAGVKPETIKAIKAGRTPTSAPKDEKAIYEFVQELYKNRRVSDKTYKRVHDLLGTKATVELVGVLGYYTLISMTLNVFRADLPDNAPLPFAEPA